VSSRWETVTVNRTKPAPSAPGTRLPGRRRPAGSLRLPQFPSELEILRHAASRSIARQRPKMARFVGGSGTRRRRHLRRLKRPRESKNCRCGDALDWGSALGRQFSNRAGARRRAELAAPRLAVRDLHVTVIFLARRRRDHSSQRIAPFSGAAARSIATPRDGGSQVRLGIGGRRRLPAGRADQEVEYRARRCRAWCD